MKIVFGFIKNLKKYGNFIGILWFFFFEYEKSNVLFVIIVEDIVLLEEFVNYVDKKSYFIEKFRIFED